MKRTSFVLIAFILSLFSPPQIRAEETPFLRQIQKDSLEFFWNHSHTKTGLTHDSNDPYSPASISATGFHLLSLVIACENGWMEHDEAYRQTKRTLKTLKTKVEHEKGFFYHFVGYKTGKRVWKSEASSVDTAVVIAGALLAGEYFKGTAVEKLAADLYDRVDWNWMLNGSKLMSHGYKPESGFLPYYWDTYSEHLILQVLAIGAKKNAVPPQVWKEWFRVEDIYEGNKVVYAHSGALFTYQLPHVFLDFRKIYDLDLNYFENSIAATRANQVFCQNNAANHETYRKGLWGLSACLGPKGYKAYGAKPGRAFHDGTISPHALIGSLPFTPEESLPSVKDLYDRFGKKIYGRYGFKSGMNLDQDWYARQYLAIELGTSIGMIENYLTQLPWKLFMKLECTQNWIRLCNLKGTENHLIETEPLAKIIDSTSLTQKST